MARLVEEDARGIVDPASGLARFRLDRFDPSPAVARFVDRYWVVSWDLPDGDSHTQQVLAHPVVNVVLQGGAAIVHGVTTRIDERTLSGTGRVLGAMFRPAGYRPLAGGSMAALTDTASPAPSPALAELAAAFDSGAVAVDDAVRAYDAHWAGVLPVDEQPSESTSALVERVAADPSVARVEAVARWTGLSVRQLQRRFADHVGLAPKSVIRRYRLYEAAERARRAGASVDWAALAAELRYSDQSHLVRDFSATFGVPPDRYARRCTPAA